MQTATLPRPGDLLDEREVAEIYKIAVRTLRNWRSLGMGPKFVKIGPRCVRYSRNELAAFIAGDASKANAA